MTIQFFRRRRISWRIFAIRRVPTHRCERGGKRRGVQISSKRTFPVTHGTLQPMFGCHKWLVRRDIGSSRCAIVDRNQLVKLVLMIREVSQISDIIPLDWLIRSTCEQSVWYIKHTQSFGILLDLLPNAPLRNRNNQGKLCWNSYEQSAEIHSVRVNNFYT